MDRSTSWNNGGVSTGRTYRKRMQGGSINVLPSPPGRLRDHAYRTVFLPQSPRTWLIVSLA